MILHMLAHEKLLCNAKYFVNAALALARGRRREAPPAVAAIRAPAPARVAIIMDGNGRWAERGGLPRVAGHEAGARAADAIVEACARAGVRELTLFAFSTENWRRPPAEVEALMGLVARWAASRRDRLVEGGVRFRALGRLDRVPAEVASAVRRLEVETAYGERMTLRMALDHGGRAEIVEAACALARAAAAGDPALAGGALEGGGLDERAFARFLPDPDMGDPDLLIRSGGERRLSNFLLWRLAYSELHVSETLWPDFDERALAAAFEDYAGRQRRFGGRSAAPAL